jgi:hypothetical protein
MIVSALMGSSRNIVTEGGESGVSIADMRAIFLRFVYELPSL